MLRSALRSLPPLSRDSYSCVRLGEKGGQSSGTLHQLAEYHSAGSSVKDMFSADEKKNMSRKPRYAITSSVQTASFAAMAVMLGYSLQKHNDLKAMDAELVLLVRDELPDGVTAENKTRLEKAGWKVRVAKELTFDGVDNGKIRSHHRHNLNKLHLWSWTEYEKILFIDADVVCKGSIAELWNMPGDFAASMDVWWDILTDNRFNSGVIVFRPSMETFHDMIPKVSDPQYHKPDDADQAFLNAYYKFRYFSLPYKYNFNLVMVCLAAAPPPSHRILDTDWGSTNTTVKCGTCSGTKPFWCTSPCASRNRGRPITATKAAMSGSLWSGTANTSARCWPTTAGKRSCRYTRNILALFYLLWGVEFSCSYRLVSFFSFFAQDVLHSAALLCIFSLLICSAFCCVTNRVALLPVPTTRDNNPRQQPITHSPILLLAPNRPAAADGVHVRHRRH